MLGRRVRAACGRKGILSLHIFACFDCSNLLPVVPFTQNASFPGPRQRVKSRKDFPLRVFPQCGIDETRLAAVHETEIKT
jgi:hypothetical protein